VENSKGAKQIATMAEKIRKLSESMQDESGDTGDPEPKEAKKRPGGKQLVIYHDPEEFALVEQMKRFTGLSGNSVYKEGLRRWFVSKYRAKLEAEVRDHFERRAALEKGAGKS